MLPAKLSITAPLTTSSWFLLWGCCAKLLHGWVHTIHKSVLCSSHHFVYLSLDHFVGVNPPTVKVCKRVGDSCSPVCMLAWDWQSGPPTFTLLWIYLLVPERHSADYYSQSRGCVRESVLSSQNLSSQGLTTLCTSDHKRQACSSLCYQVAPKLNLKCLHVVQSLEIREEQKKDCLLFSCEEMAPLAKAIADTSDKITLGKITWK